MNLRLCAKKKLWSLNLTCSRQAVVVRALIPKAVDPVQLCTLNGLAQRIEACLTFCLKLVEERDLRTKLIGNSGEQSM